MKSIADIQRRWLALGYSAPLSFAETWYEISKVKPGRRSNSYGHPGLKSLSINDGGDVEASKDETSAGRGGALSAGQFI